MKELTHEEYNTLSIKEKRTHANKILKKIKIRFDAVGWLYAKNLEYQDENNQWSRAINLQFWELYQHRIKPEGAK